MNTKPKHASKVFTWMVLLAILLAGCELLSLAFTKIRPDLFDWRKTLLPLMRAEDFERFKQQFASETLGWDNPADQTLRHRHPKCIGVETTYTYDQNRLRVHRATAARDAVVLVAGDSYTHGDEVADSESFPASLERILQVPVANFGVGGYGPEQALLKLEGLIDRFPRTRVAVLAITYDSIGRMVNSYRPVYFRETGFLFGLKPYVLNGEFHGLIGGRPFRDFPSMLAAANIGFDTDFWRRARARFPYSVAVAEEIFLPSLYVTLLKSAGRWIGRPEYEAILYLPSVRRNLRTVYDRFAHLAQSRNIHAVITFIPENGGDRTSGLLAIAAATEQQRAHISFTNVGRDFDWSSFLPGCHPTPAGYHMIAADVARVVAPLLATNQ